VTGRKEKNIFMTEVVVLGSGAARPQIGRANACYLIQTDIPLLFDFGSGALMNMLRAGIDRNRLCHLFWSHLHADHISEFIPFFFHEMCDAKKNPKLNPREALAVYGPAGTRKLVRSILRTFPGFSKARFKMEVNEVSNDTIQINHTQVKAVPIKHSPSLHALGYRIEYEGRTVVYSGDAAFTTDLINLCRDADLAVVEATCPEEHPVKTHLTASQACKAAKAAGVKKLVLTHFDPVWRDYNLKAQCAGLFDGEIVAAEDLMRIRV
jgi:ribonuclease BN (tRNA processing enzyme)